MFTTVDGSQVRITERHFIPVYDDKQHQVKVIRASFVQPEHYLLMNNKIVAIRTISTQTAVGFYAPLTLSGYLTVNGISTAVFSDWLVMHLSFCCAANVCACMFRYETSFETIQRVFLPVRVYYQLSRWMFGNDYNPYGYSSEEVHPVSLFYQKVVARLRFVIEIPIYAYVSMLLIVIAHYSEKSMDAKLR